MNFPFPSSRVPGVYIDKITESGIAEATDFLTKYWDTDSPVPNILRFEQTPLQRQWNEAFVKHRLVSGVCLKAVTESGEMVGTAMGKIYYKEKTNDPTEQELARLSSMLPKVKSHNALLDKLFREADLFPKYNVNAFMDLGRSYVKPEFRRQKLLLELNYTLMDEAHQNLGIELFVGVPTSVYTQKAMAEDKKYPFKLVHQIDFATYKVGDEYPFRNDSIHQSMQLYTVVLPVKPRQAVKEHPSHL